ncbi:kinase-like domain-containing protein [Trichoderma barbatum]
MDDDQVRPDDTLLEHIFTTKPTSTYTYLSNSEKCVFRANFDNNPVEPPRVVRVGIIDENPVPIAVINAMQEIAADCIPDLVPKPLQAGHAVDGQGRRLEFLIMEFGGEYTLAKVWDRLYPDEQSSIVNELIEALRKLHSVRISDDVVQRALRRALGEKQKELDGAVMGGGVGGFLQNGHELLDNYLRVREFERPFCWIKPMPTEALDPEGRLIESVLEGGESTIVIGQDLKQWPSEAVFCHNDINPSNVLVDIVRGPNYEEERYKLSAIIDWEMAGFYPPSYELSLLEACRKRDSNDGDDEACFGALIEGFKDLVPNTVSQDALLEAMKLIHKLHDEVRATMFT